MKVAQEFHASKYSFMAVSTAFQAALGLEALGKTAEAEAAYRHAMSSPWLTDFHYVSTQIRAFEVIAARVRLAPLLRKAGRYDEAKALEAIVAHTWSDADPGLRERVLRLSY